MRIMVPTTVSCCFSNDAQDATALTNDFTIFNFSAAALMHPDHTAFGAAQTVLAVKMDVFFGTENQMSVIDLRQWRKSFLN